MHFRPRSLPFLPLIAFAGLSAPLEAANSAARDWNEELLAAIRINVPNPPAHARNLFHMATGMYNSWAAYSPTSVGYIQNEKATAIPASPAEVELARREAISYAAYRILRARLGTGTGPGAATTGARIDAKLTSMGYSPAVAQAALTSDPTPAELGKRIGQAVLTWGAGDQFSVTNFPQAYNAQVNPNMSYPLSVLGTNQSFVNNMPLGFGIPEQTNPNFWQPLDLLTSVTQNGIPQPGGPQTFVGVQSLATTPFSLKRNDPTKPWIDPYGGPSRLSRPGSPSTSDAAYKAGALDVVEASSQLNDQTLINISPSVMGNNPLETDSGTGYPSNAVTGLPYADNMTKRGDFTRVLAEFWADGPQSETPPGHWHVLANEVADTPGFQKRIRGIGPVVNDLEWDVKTYFSLSAATHDAACAAWALKRYYSGARPITMIRHMASKGQSSDPLDITSYDPEGLPLKSGVVEVITSATVAAHHNQIWSVGYGAFLSGSFFLGQIAVKSWPAEHPANAPAPAIATNQSAVTWMLGKDWLPFQRKTFNTPAFPGYVSGHSTFSRAAAEVLTTITGRPEFPNGLGHHTVAANSLQIDLGPSVPVDLQWATYYDAADQAGQSRRFGGIHVSEDDYHGRRIGSIAGDSAYALAEKYWTGTINDDQISAVITTIPGGVKVNWNATRGMYHKIQVSTDLTLWTDAMAYTQAYSSEGTWTDTVTSAPGRKFYRVKRQPAATPP